MFCTKKLGTPRVSVSGIGKGIREYICDIDLATLCSSDGSSAAAHRCPHCSSDRELGATRAVSKGDRCRNGAEVSSGILVVGSISAGRTTAGVGAWLSVSKGSDSQSVDSAKPRIVSGAGRTACEREEVSSRHRRPKRLHVTPCSMSEKAHISFHRVW